jgi:hypothetical protein
MNRWYRENLMAMACPVLIGLAGCAAQPAAVTPAEAVAQLRTGQPLLHCRDACVGEWQRAQPQAAQLAAAGRWAELAALTIRVGYQDDLSLYYLGQAAEGLGYPGAAASYYRQSTYVAGTTIACSNLSRVCGGMAFPRAAQMRLAAIDRRLSRPRARQTAPGLQEPANPVAASPEVGPPGALDTTPSALEAMPVAPEDTAAAPAPEAAAAPQMVPPSAPTVVSGPRPGRPGASEFIEPPPAR